MQYTRTISLYIICYIYFPSNINFCPNYELLILGSVSNSFSNGPNGILTCCLYNCYHSILNLIFLLYGRALSEDKFLSVCKMYSLTKVLKADDPLYVINYSPISIILHFVKLFQINSH